MTQVVGAVRLWRMDTLACFAKAKFCRLQEGPGKNAYSSEARIIPVNVRNIHENYLLDVPRFPEPAISFQHGVTPVTFRLVLHQ